MKVSIVMSTIDNRVELLERSLWCYAKQTLKPEVIVVADRPKSRETEQLVASHRSKLDVRYFELGGPSGWRNGYGQNKGIYESTGDAIVVTHPEVMMEFDAVQAIADRLGGEDKVCVMLMFAWLSEALTQWLRDNDEWKKNIRILRELIVSPINEGSDQRRKSFVDYAKKVLGTISVAPRTGRTWWQSMAMTRKTWLGMGGFTLMNTWGSMDDDFIRRKRILGIQYESIAPALSYHQWHPSGPKDNTFQVFEYQKPEDAIRELQWEGNA